MELIFLIAIAWWLVNFEPLLLFIDWIFSFIETTALTDYVHTAFGCWKCASFWLILLTTFDFSLACLGALIAYITNLCLTRLNYKQ